MLAIVMSTFLPWWSVMLASFLSALIIPLRKSAVFFVPFIAIVCFWAIYTFILSSSNDFVLAKKIAILLPLEGKAHLLIMVTSLIGGIAAGVASMLGHQTKSIFN